MPRSLAELLSFFRFFVRGLLFAPLTVFLKLDFALYFADVFTGPVVEALAFGALKPDQIWLWHVSSLRSVKCFATRDLA